MGGGGGVFSRRCVGVGNVCFDSFEVEDKEGVEGIDGKESVVANFGQLSTTT